MRIAIIMMMGAMMVMPLGAWPANAAEGGPVDELQDQDIEVLLSTMNEVLEENRKMRGDLEQNNENIEKLRTENDILRSELKRIKTSNTAGDRQLKLRAHELEQELKKRDEITTGLKQENDLLSENIDYLESRMYSVEEQKDQLQKLLNTSILESEREDYLKMIDNAQTVARQSVAEIRRIKSENENVRAQMGENYFRLGNMLFDAKDYENAVVNYRKSLEYDRSNYWAHFNLGVIFDYYMHDDAAGIYHYNEYLKIKPLDKEANRIRERVLEMELKKNMIPGNPLKENFYANYTKKPR